MFFVQLLGILSAIPEAREKGFKDERRSEDRKETHMPEMDNTTGDTIEKESRATSEQDWTATHVPLTEEQIRATQLGVLVPLAGPVQIVDYDPQWPRLFEREAERVQTALGDQVLVLEHIGSTSVPELAAKPKIDMLLVVADSADEPAYVPNLEAAGYVLQVREPDWYEHRMFKGPDTDVNLHVYTLGCPEIDRVLLFRNWLRNHASDRQLYERTKRELAHVDWKYMQNYADAKTAVVEEILARAQGDAGEQVREDD
jgi:GrpB-like predicted nucleotidyltransferase (UPF0157 family)